MDPALPPDGATAALQGALPSTGWKAKLAKQFGKPEGRLGRLAGRIMGRNNAARSEWVLSLLEIEPVDRVLEIGFGSGEDLRRVNLVAVEGLTAGVDHSQEMVKMARDKNMSAILAGRADIRLGSAGRLPFPAGFFTKAFSINSVQFWPDRREGLHELYRVLRPGGIAAIALQPRGAADLESMTANGHILTADLEAAGFRGVRLEWSEHAKAPTICLIGFKVG